MHDGALAAARRAQEGDDLALQHFEVDVLQHLDALLVAEADALQPHMAYSPRHLDGAPGLLHWRRRVYYLEESLSRGYGPDEAVDHHARLPDRHRQHLHVEQELRQLSRTQVAVDRPVAPVPEDQPHGDEEGKGQGLHHHGLRPEYPDHGARNVRILCLEPPLLVLLGGEGLDHAHPSEVLLKHGAQLGHVLHGGPPQAPQPDSQLCGNDGPDGDKAYSQQPKLPVQSYHDESRAYYEEDEVGAPYDAADNEHPHSFDVGNGPGHEVAGVLPVVEAEAEALDAVVKGVAKIVDDGFG